MKKLYDMKELACALSINVYLKSIEFNPFPWQEEVVKYTGNKIILLCSRQAGKSTIVSAVPCHSAKYYPGSLNIVIAPKEDQAVEDILKIKDFIAHDPTYPRLTRSGSDIIALENGSRILIVIATDNAARGYSKPRVVLLDEASRIPDVVYKSGVIPMLNNSPSSKLYILSTPFGQEGFFYEIWTRRTSRWKKIFVRTPWDPSPEDPQLLVPAIPESEFSALCAADGVVGMYSPNHADREYQTGILEEIGVSQYRQEFCCDFVERDGQVFAYEDINRLFGERVAPMPSHDSLGTAAGVLAPKSIGGRFF